MATRFSTRFVLCIGLLSLLGSKWVFQQRLRDLDIFRGPDTEELKASYRGDALKKFTFGYDSFLASLIWVRLLQEAKYTAIQSNKISWEYSEVDAVTTLDPNFTPAYNFGALYVSFFRRDKIGGLRILEKWVNHSPRFWKSHHMLGMHYFLELNDYGKAAPHIIKASQLPGAPAYIASLGIGLLGQSGASLFGLQSACELFETATQPEARVRLAKRIRGLRWHLEKQAWNEALVAFRLKHKKSPSSLTELIPFLKNQPSRNVASAIPQLESSADLRTLFSENFQFTLSKDRTTVEAANPNQAKEFDNLGVTLQKDSP